MAMLHDAGMPARLKQRVQSLRPDSPRRWGKMTVDQMLWHVNQPLREALGDVTLKDNPKPIPRGALLWIVLNLPWGHGAPTHPEMVAREPRQDFEPQKKLCLELIDRLAAKDISAAFPRNGTFGDMTGVKWSRLMAKHLDHHLRQFGV